MPAEDIKDIIPTHSSWFANKLNYFWEWVKPEDMLRRISLYKHLKQDESELRPSKKTRCRKCIKNARNRHPIFSKFYRSPVDHGLCKCCLAQMFAPILQVKHRTVLTAQFPNYNCPMCGIPYTSEKIINTTSQSGFPEPLPFEDILNKITVNFEKNVFAELKHHTFQRLWKSAKSTAMFLCDSDNNWYGIFQKGWEPLENVCLEDGKVSFELPGVFFSLELPTESSTSSPNRHILFNYNFAAAELQWHNDGKKENHKERGTWVIAETRVAEPEPTLEKPQ